MKTIWVIGASGRSSSSLIQYLVDHQTQEDWSLLLTDIHVEALKLRYAVSDRLQIHTLDIENADQRAVYIQKADLVVSMLPAFMHKVVAQECVEHKKHLVTASYVSDEMAQLHDQAIANGVILLNEVGLDPGIDHMSAMQIMDVIRSKGGEIKSFKSYCGGLIAPESDTNPWNYKFTWNPRNVILAGSGGSVKFLENNRLKYIPYHQLFVRTETLHIDAYGSFDGYANRDSLKYVQSYGLENASTVFRGTLRRQGFCEAWNVFVQLGMTDDSFLIDVKDGFTSKDFLRCFLPESTHDLRSQIQTYLSLDKQVLDKIEWLGFFNGEPIEPKKATPAQILQSILEKKWVLESKDKDMVVMLHQIEYILNGTSKKIQSSMVVLGENSIYTAMAKTVGLPVAICTKLILQGKITQKGVVIPTKEDIYHNVLDELSQYGICFTEKELN